MKSIKLFLILFGVILFSGWLFVDDFTQNFIYILNEKDFEFESKLNNFLLIFDLILPQVFGVILLPTQHFHSSGSEENSNDIWLIDLHKKPHKPTNLQVTHIGNQQVSLSWSEPTKTGNTAITDYKIKQKGIGVAWITVSEQNGNLKSIATTATVTGLTNGQLYEFKVFAKNDAGYGPGSRLVSATPANLVTAPDKPTNLTATGINATSIALSWKSPSTDGGSTIIGYKIERNLNSNGFMGLVDNTNSAILNYSDTTLSLGDIVQYQVTAINSHGHGSPSKTTSLITLNDMIVPKTLNISELKDIVATNNTFSVYHTIIEKSLENSIVKIDLPSDLLIYKSVDSNDLIKIVEYTGIANLSNISGILSGSLVDIGDPNHEVNFDKAVKITLFGKSGNSAFYIDSDNVTHMINQCSKIFFNFAAATTYLSDSSIRECYHNSNSDLIIWTTHFTGFGSTSTVLDSDSKKLGGDDNVWMSKPTFGLSHKTNSPIVQCGFSWDDICYDITDNWHTPFEKVSVMTGTQYNMTMKAYFEHPPLFMEFALVPELEKFNEFETKIEVIFENNFNNYYHPDSITDGDADFDITDVTIKSISVIQRENIIDESLLNGTISKVSCGYITSDCYELSINGIMFRDVPLFEKIGLLAADTERRFQITYLNDGFNIDGISLNPANTDTINHHSKVGLFQVIQLDRFENLWSDEDGIIYTHNDFKSWIRLTPITFERYQDPEVSVMTRMHSDFGGLIEQQRKIAEQTFAEKFGDYTNDKPFTFTPTDYTKHYDVIDRSHDVFAQYVVLQEEIA